MARLVRGVQPPALRCLIQGAKYGREPSELPGQGQGAEARLGVRVWAPEMGYWPGTSSWICPQLSPHEQRVKPWG